jgi:hypothetical protein
VGPLLPIRILCQQGDKMKFTKNIGMLLLSVWLIVTGLMALVPALSFSGEDKLRAILAIAAGVFILIGR